MGSVDTTEKFATPYGVIEMRPALQERLGDVVVLGLGKSGLGAARYLLDQMNSGQRVTSVTVYPGAATARCADQIAELTAAGARVVPDLQVVGGSFDLAVVSPGIPQPGEFYQSAAACARQIISEPELAWRESPWGWVGITGTNGKTTTTSLIASVLNRCGIEALPVGNIGAVCIDAITSRKPGQLLVAELSSFQLASMPTFSPEVGVLLNITPDHIEWHGTLEAYAEAKLKLFANLAPRSLSVIDADDAGASPAIGRLRAAGHAVVGVGGERKEGCAACIDGVLGYQLPGQESWQELGSEEGLQIKGAHNTKNALAAACACAHFGIPAQKLYQALTAFRPIEHRIEPAGTVDGVFYCNDSKATNTDATIKALTAFGDKPLIVLLGGHDKMTDLSDLVAACAARCKAVVLFGASRERFAAAFAPVKASGTCQVLEADHLPQALEAARAIAVAGDAVALSPACSSYDEFTCYQERGDTFKRLVSDLPGTHE